MASFNTLHHGDCIAGMKDLPDGCIDLAFADPPYNIGYEYDAYDDRKTCDEYLDWCRTWTNEVVRVLKPDGAFWLAIGDEYAAELKVMLTREREQPLYLRSWVVWYYTFGVNCKNKFTRSHAHLLYFVKDRERFTFNADDPAVRVPSARQLVYGDKRANPKGRLPDDTWVMRPEPGEEEQEHSTLNPRPSTLNPPLSPHTHNGWFLRPQDVPNGFGADGDVWYFPRVAGTFKERSGWHGCQMPERLLARIIQSCSKEGEVVLDPFAGSGTTLAVAKKLNRDWLGYDMSSEYVANARSRLDTISPGDPLTGAEDPLTSAPKTGNGRKLRTH